MPDFAKALGAAKGASTLIRLDASSPRRRFSCVALGAGTVFDRPGPKTVLPGWRCPDAFGLVSSDVLALVRKASPWRKPREPVASDVVTTVDQSENKTALRRDRATLRQRSFPGFLTCALMRKRARSGTRLSPRHHRSTLSERHCATAVCR